MLVSYTYKCKLPPRATTTWFALDESTHSGDPGLSYLLFVYTDSQILFYNAKISRPSLCRAAKATLGPLS